MNEPSMPSPGERPRAGSEMLPSSSPDDDRRSYRLSDAERSAAIAELSDAYAEGRLDADEFEVRMAAASQARLSHELQPLFDDLPGPHRVRASVPQRSSAPRPAATHPYPPSPRTDWRVAGPPWASSGYPAQCAPRYVRRPDRRAARHHPGPIAFMPFVFLMLIGTSAAFLIPLLIVALVGVAHLAPHARRR